MHGTSILLLTDHDHCSAAEAHPLNRVLRRELTLTVQTGCHKTVQAAPDCASACENTKHAGQSGRRQLFRAQVSAAQALDGRRDALRQSNQSSQRLRAFAEFHHGRYGHAVVSDCRAKVTDLHGENSLLYHRAFRQTCHAGYTAIMHRVPWRCRRQMYRLRVRSCCALIAVLRSCICRLRLLGDARLLALRPASAEDGAIRSCVCIPARAAVNSARSLQDVALQLAMPRKCTIFLVRAGCCQQMWQALEGIWRQWLSQPTEPHCARVMISVRLAGRCEQRHRVWCHAKETPSSGADSQPRRGEAGIVRGCGRGRGRYGGERAAHEMLHARIVQSK